MNADSRPAGALIGTVIDRPNSRTDWITASKADAARRSCSSAPPIPDTGNSLARSHSASLNVIPQDASTPRRNARYVMATPEQRGRITSSSARVPASSGRNEPIWVTGRGEITEQPSVRGVEHLLDGHGPTTASASDAGHDTSWPASIGAKGELPVPILHTRLRMVAMGAFLGAARGQIFMAVRSLPPVHGFLTEVLPARSAPP